MTGFWWLASVLTAIVAGGALGLGLLLARRLRLLQERVARLAEPFGPDLPEAGAAVPDFTATTTDGERLSSDDLAGPDVLVLFLTASCRSCEEEAAGLEQFLAAAGADGPRPVAVVIGEEGERAALVAALEPLARVVGQSYPDGLAGRFGVRGFPGVLIAGDGAIRQAAHGLDELRIGAPA